ncbi:ABC transporter substrate-binding protein [Wukongibacter sp. M2B1]|uniref:ABC transporter substrate-binding protein n=1 Tax=Wukongibacter sp. M2B1 TaxID=3088895 RepID=UPI003D79E60A
MKLNKGYFYFLVLCLCLFIGITGCAEKEVEQADTNSSKEDHQVDAVEVEKNVITDQNNREVIVPENMERVVMTALPLPSIYALTGASVDKIVGMHPGAKSAIENSVMAKMAPKLLEVETDFIEGTDLNIEEVLKLKPDLAFYWGSYTNQERQWNEVGIPAIAVKTQGEGDALQTLSSWLEIFGKVFHKESEVEKVIEYGEKALNDIQEETRGISEDEKTKSLILFKHSEAEITVPGKGHYGQFWIEATGGYNTAREIDVTANVSMEQIYKWNPEVIFISSFTQTMPEDLYENTIPGQDWSKVDAVKKKQVYKIPVGVYRWYPPSGDVPLMIKWMAKHQYPDVFSYINLEDEMKRYYEEFYGYGLSTDEINTILNPTKETAQGTGGLSKQ